MTTSTITVQSGAKLALPESGTVTLAGPLTLASGAALSFNFTDAAAAPVLAKASGKSVSVSGAVTVGISGNASAKNAPYALTTCGGFGSAAVTLAAGSLDWAKLSVDDDGNIVLGKKQGFILVVR